MYFAKTKHACSATAATLLMTLSLTTPVFAADTDETTLTNNERAAQNAIAYSPINVGHVSSESVDATLANNEDAARRAITNRPSDSEFANFRTTGSISSTTSEATLLHNELSAQHAIVTAPAHTSFSDDRRLSAAPKPSTSNQPGAMR